MFSLFFSTRNSECRVKHVLAFSWHFFSVSSLCFVFPSIVILTSSPIRGAGDGMETEEPPKSIEVTPGIQPIKHHILPSPRKKAVPSESPGVLQLGKILAEKAVEVEAVRILVPKAAITHDIPNKNAKVKSLGHHKGEFLGQPEGVEEPRKELSEVKNILEKLKNSERRLLQDKEGLSNQLRVQSEVRTALIGLMSTSLYTWAF